MSQPSVPSKRPAFEAFYREAYPEAVRLAHVMSGSDSGSEDIAQDAFVAMHRKWDSVDNPPAYLRRAITNGVAAQFRSKARRGARERRHGATEASVDNEYDHTLSAIDGLPFRMKAVIVLRYYHGCSEREIAEALNLRAGTVKSLASRGLDRLRKEIAS